LSHCYQFYFVQRPALCTLVILQLFHTPVFFIFSSPPPPKPKLPLGWRSLRAISIYMYIHRHIGSARKRVSGLSLRMRPSYTYIHGLVRVRTWHQPARCMHHAPRASLPRPPVTRHSSRPRMTRLALVPEVTLPVATGLTGSTTVGCHHQHPPTGVSDRAGIPPPHYPAPAPAPVRFARGRQTAPSSPP
jgi:hypothetical protein